MLKIYHISLVNSLYICVMLIKMLNYIIVSKCGYWKIIDYRQFKEACSMRRVLTDELVLCIGNQANVHLYMSVYGYAVRQ